MIELVLPVWLLWLLRWGLFLGPLTAVLFVAHRRRQDQWALVGGLFAFLYGLGTIFITHELAASVGWWRYGGETLMFCDIPTDIWIGGALLFGPVLAVAFPKASPLVLLVPIFLGLHGTLFLSLPPLLYPGANWFFGVVFVFVTAHMPAIYLAQWTATRRQLPLRVAILAIGFGCLAFVVLPSAIMQAMGGEWALFERSPWLLGVATLAMSICCILGLTAVQMFALYGNGTAIPLDPTERLVRVGIFAYVRNPMQLCSALMWILLGIVLQNIWVASAAAMAWVFVAGMVRWHHRYDLQLRFPEGWTEYTAHVPEWRPRWRPWFKHMATLTYDTSSASQSAFVQGIQRQGTSGLDIRPVPGALRYACPGEHVGQLDGGAAAAMAMHHTHFLGAMTGAAILLVVLPSAYLRTAVEGCPLVARLSRAN
jgi:protein-S-isoprenylcysteine O-methyltransferase Ste14